MSKVITFSRVFPATHPRKGKPTYFVEKIWKSLWDLEPSNYIPFDGYWQTYDEAFPTGNTFDANDNIHSHQPKHHTIRAGNHWKVGDKFSPRVWSGEPYKSKQIIIAPDIEIKKIWDFDCTGPYFFLNEKQIDVTSCDIPMNDGLNTDDFLNWFPEHPKKKDKWFKGQILCWNESINY